MSSDRVRVFKRLETDAEFALRVFKSAYTYYTGEALDNYVWTYFRMQRRIVEDMC